MPTSRCARSIPEFTSEPVELRPPWNKIELRLTRGAVAVARLPDVASRSVGARVVLSPSAPAAADASPIEIDTRVESGELRFGGFSPGTYSVWIDVPGFAPATVERADLGPAITSLGVVELSKGLALRVRVAGSATAAANTMLTAKSLATPSYVRAAGLAPGEPLLLRGLAAGRFEVRVQLLGSEPRAMTRTVDLDGDAELSFD